MKKFILLSLLFFSNHIFAQRDIDDLKKSKGIDQFDVNTPKIEISQYDILKQIEPMATTGTMYNDQFFESAVEPNKYIVGPNDIFSLGIWGILNQPLPLIVSPEGSLIVPSIGEINVNGLTLADAKEKVISKVKGRYISAVISLTLVSPRRFLVNVTGVGQGTYPTSATLRASALIGYIMSDSVTLMKSRTSPSERGYFSIRNITLERENGEKIRIDLLKYYATKDGKYNPFLREGDVINIPKYDWEGRFLSVQGAVQYPGAYEYIEGDDLETALQLCRGVTSVANLDSIILTRADPSAQHITNTYLKYEENKYMKLQPNDRITILAYAEQRRDFRVYVLGEVIRPGYYSIGLNNTKISELIKEAGGLTLQAYLPNSELYRRIDTLQFLGISSLKRDSAESFFTQRLNDVISNKDEREQFESDTKFRIGRVNVNFQKLFEGDNSQDIIVRPGDIIYIPDNKKQIYVYGQVNKPGFVPFKEGADYQYYIDAAGGLSERADEDEIRVIKYVSREWLEPDEAKIESSDFIYVPKILKRDFAYDIDLIAKIAAVVASIATITILIIQSQR